MSAPSQPASLFKTYGPMLFRLFAVLAIGWLLGYNQQRLAAQGDQPIRISEVREIIPEAHNLRFDPDAQGGYRILASGGSELGYVTRSMPQARSVNGYSGPTDVLMAFGADDRLRGISIRHSYDTPSHIADVVIDSGFMAQWNGLTWEEIAAKDPNEVFSVSGASRSSEAIGKGLHVRTQAAPVSAGFNLRWQDGLLALLAALGVGLSFWKQKSFQRKRTAIHVLMVVALGFVLGDFLAQSLLVNWGTHGVPWRNLPGLVLLAAVAFVIPWSTGRKTYCTQICPHGHVQRWLVKLLPSRFKPRMRHDEKWSFRALPGLLLVAVLLIGFLRLPLDLAGFEAFDAWLLWGAGTATLTVCGLGLIYSIFVPMGYCRHACPTGFLLDLVRREREGFVRRDLWLVALLALAILITLFQDPIRVWMFS